MIKGFLFYDNKRIVKVSLKRKKSQVWSKTAEVDVQNKTFNCDAFNHDDLNFRKYLVWVRITHSNTSS